MGAGSEAETGGGGGGFTDAFFGIGIVNPLVGSTALEQRMEGRRRVRLSQMRSAMRGGDIDGDWVTMAVVVFKGEPRNSQNVTTSSISFLFFSKFYRIAFGCFPRKLVLRNRYRVLPSFTEFFLFEPTLLTFHLLVT